MQQFRLHAARFIVSTTTADTARWRKEKEKNQFTYVHINGHMKLIEALLGLIKKVFHISGKNLVGAITARQSTFFA